MPAVLAVLLSVVAWGSGRPGSVVQAADLVDVTVRITKVVEVEDQDGDGSDGDFYTQVDIDGQGFQQSSRVEDDEFGEDAMGSSWRFTRTVDRATTGPVDISIRLKDYDDGLAGDDDFADISPRDKDVELNVRYSPFSGRWNVTESDVQGTVAEGDGDHGFPEDNDGRIARIEFQVFMGGGADQDGDGIPDAVELAGVRRTDAVDLAFLGANPCQKTILVEVDWMQGAADNHNHRPKGPALDEIRTAFRNAPIPAPATCPYQGFTATGGVQLIITPSNSIPEAPVFTLDDLDATRNNPANFDPQRRPYFHYVVFAHDQEAGSSSSGLCCRQGKDFIVTLGSWNLGDVCVTAGPDGVLNTTVQGDDQAAGSQITYGGNGVCDTLAGNGAAPPPAVNDDAQALPVGVGRADAQVGTVRDQSGTMMHELGHALGLGHRGRDDVNHAPNYLSNMSYFFQQGIPLAASAGSVLDWSGAVLPTLTEDTLSETAVLDAASPYNTFWYDPTGRLWTGRVAQPINWDRLAGPTTVRVDVNLDNGCVSFGADGARNSTPGGDDVVSRGVIVNGPNHRCETTTSGDDMPILTGAGGTPLNQTCVGIGANERRDSTAAGDDVTFTNAIHSGPNLVCDTTAQGDDIQVVPVGASEPLSHPGWNDWANIRFRAVDSPNASGAGAGHVGDQTFEDVLHMHEVTADLLDPDIAAVKTVDRTVASAGDRLTYTTTARNVGTGEATDVSFTDTLPDGKQVTKTATSNVLPGASTSAEFAYDVPCGLADGTVLVNSVTITAKDLQAQPEANTRNNTATASTTVRSPVLTLDKTATGSVGSGEAITYALTYANVGSGGASNVVITDTIPAGVYYSPALDTGSGPRPTSVVLNADGTRTLTWSVGALPGGSAEQTIRFTARPTLLSAGGTTYENRARLEFTDAGGCTYPPVVDAANTTIATVPPTRNPGTLGYWGHHPETWTAELRARVHATDQRYDTDRSGDLSNAEITTMFAPGGTQPKVLQMQLLATYLNLGSRRIDAGTQLTASVARRLWLANVREGALYAIQTLTAPPTSANRNRYSDATTVLDDINNGRGLRY